MTSYTKRRGYPYPSSERETGNGGLHSEMLARAVAEDLDGVDAGWADLRRRPVVVAGLSGNSIAYSPNILYSVLIDTVEKQVGTTLTVTGVGLDVETGGEGWYHVTGQVHSKAVGTITADAQHRVQLEHIVPLYGNLATKRMYYADQFQSGILDMYTMIEAMIHLSRGEEIRMRFFHTNTGSDVQVLQAGTHLTASVVVLDSA